MRLKKVGTNKCITKRRVSIDDLGEKYEKIQRHCKRWNENGRNKKPGIQHKSRFYQRPKSKWV